jgi:hypothetical protein
MRRSRRGLEVRSLPFPSPPFPHTNTIKQLAAREEAALAEEKAEKAARRRARRERHERHKRERAEGIDRSERRRSHRESHSESDSTSDEGDKVRNRDRHGSLGDRDRDREREKPRAIEGVNTTHMSGALLGGGEKKLPTKEDLLRSGIKENPEAPGQYLGYTRNPPPPPEAVMGKLRKTESH